MPWLGVVMGDDPVAWAAVTCWHSAVAINPFRRVTLARRLVEVVGRLEGLLAVWTFRRREPAANVAGRTLSGCVYGTRPAALAGDAVTQDTSRVAPAAKLIMVKGCMARLTERDEVVRAHGHAAPLLAVEADELGDGRDVCRLQLPARAAHQALVLVEREYIHRLQWLRPLRPRPKPYR